jgi:hypothetical protein
LIFCLGEISTYSAISAILLTQANLLFNLHLGKQVFDPNAPSPFWFYHAVRNGDKWDYKQRALTYKNFGNFNYGATEAAAGFSRQTLLSEAGKLGHHNLDGVNPVHVI